MSVPQRLYDAIQMLPRGDAYAIRRIFVAYEKVCVENDVLRTKIKRLEAERRRRAA